MSTLGDEEVRHFTPDLEKQINRIHTSEDGTIVHMGPYSFHKDELVNAFGGNLNPGIAPMPPIRGLNSVPMGLASFAFCSFVVSLFHVQARDASNQSILIGSCFFYGGVIEVISGLMALIVDNTFAGTALGCFGGFWLSYGAILCNAFGIVSSYTTEEEYHSALGFFLTGWFMFSFVIWLCTFKSTWPFFSLFFLIWVWILVLAIGTFQNNANIIKAGGVLGLLASFNGLYLM